MTDPNGSISPIETLYKGYRFRSRLEARWAVFFDALGVRWEYEQEGFELSGGIRYLPDFYLPDQDCYTEVKPRLDGATKNRPETVYMAGKIGQNDWRHEIVPGLRGAWWGDTLMAGPMWYVGPYFTGCDHGCTHGESAHGSQEGCGMGPERNQSLPEDPRERGRWVARECTNSVRSADRVFAWIDSLDAYGTLVEVGMGKLRPWVAFERSFYETLVAGWRGRGEHGREGYAGFGHDLWFLEALASKVDTSHDNARDAYLAMCDPPPVGWDRLAAVCKAKGSRGLLLEGSPWVDEYAAYFVNASGARTRGIVGVGLDSVGKIILTPKPRRPHQDEEQPILNAMERARSARFEHGERG